MRIEIELFSFCFSVCSDEGDFTESLWLSQVMTMYLEINVYATMATICIVGVIGNLLSFYTFGKLRMKNSSTTLLRALAFVDSWLLFTYLFENIVDVIYLTIRYVSFSGASTTLYNVLKFGILWNVFPFACTAVIWTPVMLGIHRYIVVCQPLSAVRICTAANARKHFIYILVFYGIINFPGLFEFRIEKSQSQNNATDLK